MSNAPDRGCFAYKAYTIPMRHDNDVIFEEEKTRDRHERQVNRFTTSMALQHAPWLHQLTFCPDFPTLSSTPARMTYNFFASEPPRLSLPQQASSDLVMPDVQDRDSLPVAKNGFHIDQLEAVSFERNKRNNIPARFELFYLEPGKPKITIEPETRVPNAAIFKFAKEDHTLANLLRSRLLQSSNVLFSAYKVPHPLFPDFELRVQTDGSITPKAALLQACRDIVGDLGALGREFTKEWEIAKAVAGGRPDGL